MRFINICMYVILTAVLYVYSLTCDIKCIFLLDNYILYIYKKNFNISIY